MADVNANIGVHIDTSSALAGLKNLQRQLATFHSSISQGSAASAAAQKSLQTNLLNSINATGMFTAKMGLVKTSTESFTHALETNKLTMREYYRYAGASTKTFGRLFKSEFDTIGKVAQERVKKMQTQYIKMGRDASGAVRAMAITPTSLNMKDYSTQAAVAAQKQALFNQLVRQGSTNLLNFGKNTQWAGRQLMVGFSIPLAYFGAAAAKTFMALEAQAVRFKRVYGEMFTTSDQTDKALKQIQQVAQSFVKYGVKVEDTMKMAADAAAMGKMGADLQAQVAQATKLAVLGNVDQQKALETTISLTNAFGISADQLASKINFLNAVENQTVVNIEDLTTAIPKAGPVVQQLGGSVEDLAYFLTAMKEGGINASEGANALKSGLASLINPSKKASEMLAGFGINVKGIVNANAGNLKATVLGFAQALDTLAPLDRARAIEQMFGKFQFARLSTLFQNITKDGSQANRVLGLTNASVEELAILSEREMKKVQDAVGTNFKSSMENLKLQIAPIGKTFLEAVTPIVKFLGKVFEKFSGLDDGVKKFIVTAGALVGIIGPVLLMTFGLVANGVANIIKLFLAMRTGFMKIGASSTNLAEQTTYLNAAQLESATVAASLNQAHTQLTQKFEFEAAAVQALRNAYIEATVAASNFARANPGMMGGGRPGVPRRFAAGTTSVPGPKGAGDVVPSLLTPGEAVIPAPVAQNPNFAPIIDGMVNGTIAMHGTGTTGAGDNARSGSSYRGTHNLIMGRSGFDNGPLSKPALLIGESGVSFEGQIFNAKTAKSAQSIKNFVDGLVRNPDGTLTYIDPQNPSRNGTFTKQRLQTIFTKYSERGELDLNSIKRGLMVGSGQRGTQAGSSRPSWVKTLVSKAVKADATIFAEQAAIEGRLAEQGITLSQAQKKNVFGIDASHIVKEVDAQGNKVWRAANIAPEPGYINKYLNDQVEGKKLTKELQAKTDAQLKNLGIDRAELNRLGAGQHPTTANSAATLRAIARYQIASSPNSPSIYQAHLVDSGIGYRLERGLYKGGIKSLADRLPNDKRVKQEIAVAKGELIQTADGKYIPVTGKTGRAKTAQEVTRSPQDTRVVETRNIRRVIPKSAVPRFMPGAITGYTGPGVRPGEKLSSMSDQFKAEQNSLRRQIEKQEKRRLAGLKAEEKARLVEERQRKQIAQSRMKQEADMAKVASKARAGLNSFSNKATTGLGALSGLTIAASFAGGQLGEMAQKAMPVVFGLQGIAMLLPMMTKWSGLIGAAVAAWVISQRIIDMAAKNARNKILDLADAVAPTGENLQKFAEFAGKVSPAELLAYRQQKARNPLSIQQGKSTYGEMFAGSETGKALAKGLREVISGGGMKAGVETLKTQLSAAVASGIFTTAQARSIALSIGREVGNLQLGLQVNAQIADIFGPDGSKISGTNGINLRVNLIADQTKKAETLAAQTRGGRKGLGFMPVGANKVLGGGMDKGLFTGVSILGAGSAGAFTGATVGAGIGAAVGTAAGGVGALPGAMAGSAIGTVVGAIVGIGTGAFMATKYMSQAAARVAGFAAQTTTAYKSATDLSNQMQAALQLSYEEAIKKAKIEGDINKVRELERQYAAKALRLQEQGQKTRQSFTDFYKDTKGLTRRETRKALEETVKRKYKDDAIQSGYLGSAKDTAKALSGTLEGKVQFMMGNGSMTPQQVTALGQMFGDAGSTKQAFNIVAQIDTKFGGTTAGTATDISAGFTNLLGKQDETVTKKFLVDVRQAKTQKDADKLLNLYGSLTTASGSGQIDVAMLVSYYQKNTKAANALETQLEAIQANAGKLEISILPTFLPAKVIGAINEKYFNSLDQNARQVYTTTIAQILNVGDPTIVAGKDYKNWEAETGPYGGVEWSKNHPGASAQSKVQGYAEARANRFVFNNPGITPVQGPGGGGNDGSKQRDTTYDDILNSLKRTRDATINAMGGAKELMRILGGKKDLQFFKGLDQQLAKLGANTDFIDWIGGLEKAIQGKLVTVSKKGVAALTELGKAAKKAFDEKQLGLFSAKSENAITAAKKQRDSFIKLKNAGVSTTDALEMMGDTEFSISLAAQKNQGEVKRLVTEYKTMKQEADLTLAMTDPKAYFADINDELQRQYDYQQKIMQLQKSATESKIAGDYIGASMYQQQQVQETSQFNFDSKPIDINGKLATMQQALKLVGSSGLKDKTQQGLIQSTLSQGMLGINNLRSITPDMSRATSLQNNPLYSNAFGNTPSSTTQAGASTVYNVNMTVNGSNASADDIANQVIRKISLVGQKNNKSNAVKP